MRRFFMLFASSLLVLAGCNKQEIVPQTGEGQVTISLGVPGDMGAVTKAETYQNSAKGGVTNVGGENLKWNVKIYYGTNEVCTKTATGANFTENFQLVMGETYRLVARADFASTDVFNSEKEDFYVVEQDFEAKAAVSATLKRPVGKLRLVANDYALAMGQMSKTVTNVELFLDGASVGVAEMNSYLDETATSPKTLFVDYLPVKGSVYKFDKVILTLDDNTTRVYPINLDVPIKANALTTVKGNLFTGTTTLSITVDEDFENGEEEYTLDGAVKKTAADANEANAIINTTEENPKISLTLPAEANNITLGEGFTSANTTESILYLNYTDVPSTITINQNGFSSTDNPTSGASKGKVVVTVPAGTDVSTVIITAPNMTVELLGGTYTNVDALTANSTLVVKNGVTIKALNVRGGNVYVEAGATVEAIKKNNQTPEELTNGDVNKKPIYIFAESGAVIPTLPKGDFDNSIAIVPVTDIEQWNLICALATADSYTLQANSIISSTIVIEKPFTLDLNGYTITNDSDLYNVYDSQRFMTVVCRGGHLTIKDSKGTGKIATKDEETSGNTSANLAVALTHYGEEKWASNTPASLTVEGGHLYGTGYGISGNGTRYNTIININGGTIESDNHAIYHPQDGNFTMTGGTLKGKSGIEIRGGGDYTISGGTIEATASWEFKQASGTTTADGGAVVVNIYDQERRDLNLNITGGTFTGAKTIYDHDLTYNTYTGTKTIKISGGTFNNFDFENYLTDNADVKVVMNANADYGKSSLSSNQKVSVDVNGHVLTIKSLSPLAKGVAETTLKGNAELKIFDSTQSGIPTEANLVLEAPSENAFEVEGDAKLTLNNIKCVRNVFAFLRANKGTVNIDNCDLTDKYYITNTNANCTIPGILDKGSGSVYNITNSVFTTSETPLMMNVPLTMNISNTTLNGKWQCAMVRGGTLNMTACTLNYTRDGAFAEMTSWLSGNQVPKAAITGGTKGTGVYQYPTSITIDANTTINMLGANNTNPKIYLYGDGLNTVNYTGPWGTEDGSVMIGSTEKVTVNQ